MWLKNYQLKNSFEKFTRKLPSGLLITLWCDVVKSRGRTGWQEILLTRNRCPDILVAWLTDKTWVNLDWSLNAKCHKFKVPLACFVTIATTGDGEDCSGGTSGFLSSSLARNGLLLLAGSDLLVLELWFTWGSDWLSSSWSSWSWGDGVGWGPVWPAGASKCNKFRKSKTWNGLNNAKWVLKVEASPKGTALGSRELNDTWAWRKEPGVYSSNQSTSLQKGNITQCLCMLHQQLN